MSTFVGTPTIAERLADSNVLWKSICKRVAYTMRVALPGVIKFFDPDTQLCSVQIVISENIILNELIKATPIPILDDVLLMLPGDSEWCITFPSLIDSECLVMFADMCISAWSTNGAGSSGVQNQEVTRRHNLSDGFAMLRPRSQPNVIPNYSTTALEIRNLEGSTKIALSASGIDITIDASDPLTVNAPLVVNGSLVANSLATTQTPSSSSTLSNFSVPIVLNGVTYYLRLSSTP